MIMTDMELMVLGRVGDPGAKGWEGGDNVKLRREVQLFANAMERKLRENDYKAGWKGCTEDYLIMRTKQELEELLNCHSDSDLALDEAADVANFLMMLCDIRGHLQIGRG